VPGKARTGFRNRVLATKIMRFLVPANTSGVRFPQRTDCRGYHAEMVLRQLGVSVMNDRRASTSSWLTVRPATEGDLPEVADMVQGFVHGHPAEHHPRPLARLKEAYFGSEPVAHLLVASTRGRLVGMGQWTRIYDMLWAMFGGEVGWLYVRPEARGLGIVAAIIAEISQQVRRAGGELLRGTADQARNSALYERVARAWSSRECYLSAEAFQSFADLAGLPPREIVRQLPKTELNRVAAQPR
jgi:GNAT superfamily N-acetyltransferase